MEMENGKEAHPTEIHHFTNFPPFARPSPIMIVPIEPQRIFFQKLFPENLERFYNDH